MDEPAERKAMSLLVAWLNPEQAHEFADHQFFHVKGSKGGVYLIKVANGPYNVTRFDAETGKRIEDMCFVPDPGKCQTAGDIMLAQKILLETDEEKALDIANHHENWMGRHLAEGC